MIPLAAPIALAVFAVLAWRYETRSWRAYEATLSPAEKRQFRAFRRIHPSKWRASSPSSKPSVSREPGPTCRLLLSLSTDRPPGSDQRLPSCEMPCGFTPAACSDVLAVYLLGGDGCCTFYEKSRLGALLCLVSSSSLTGYRFPMPRTKEPRAAWPLHCERHFKPNCGELTPRSAC